MAEFSGEKHSPRRHDINKPNQHAGYHPDDGDSDQFCFRKEKSQRKQQVSDITHPEHVTKLIDLPVMNCLAKEEHQRKKSERSKLP